jgi:hypothetical protein
VCEAQALLCQCQFAHMYTWTTFDRCKKSMWSQVGELNPDGVSIYRKFRHVSPRGAFLHTY